MRKVSVFLIVLLLPASAQAPPDRLAETQKKLKKTDAATTRELIEQADKDPDPRIRRAILDRLGRLHLAGVREFLERHAAGDPDAGTALVALERLRILQAQDLGQLFDKRLALAKSQKDEKALETLTPAHQRWVTNARGPPCRLSYNSLRPSLKRSPRSRTSMWWRSEILAVKALTRPMSPLRWPPGIAGRRWISDSHSAITSNPTA